MNVNDIESRVGEFCPDIFRIPALHVVIRPVPLGVVARHNFQTCLLILQSILQVADTLACMIVLQTRETVQQCKSGGKIDRSQKSAQRKGGKQQNLLADSHRHRSPEQRRD